MALTAGVVSLSLFVGFRPVDRLVDRWATAHGLELDDDARALIAARLRTGRRIRTLGFVIGYSAPILWASTHGSFVWAFTALFPVHSWNLAGYFAGALIAELWFARSSSPVGVAVLAPRNLADYLSPAARLTPRLLAAGTIVAGIAYLVAPARNIADGTPGEQLARHALTGSTLRMWISVAFVVGIVVLIELMQRAVLRRRQQFSTESLVRADDSLRGWSVRILAWVCLTVASGALAVTLIPLGFKTGLLGFGNGGTTFFYVLAGYGPMLVALISFRWLSRPFARWHVRRVALQPA